MKNFIAYIILGLFSITFVGNASPIHHGAVDVVVNSFVQKGDLVMIDMIITAEPKAIETHRTLTLTPVLITDNNRHELPVVILNGRNRQRSLERAIVFDKVVNRGEIFQALEVNRKTPTIVNYQIAIPYNIWMKEAALVIEENLCNCGGDRGEFAKNTLNETLELDFTPHQISPSVTFLIPEVEKIKSRRKMAQAYLNYKDGKSQIIPNFRTNRDELKKIDSFIMRIENDKNVSVQGIVIKGYASPEGSSSFNEKLSKDRAKAMKLYMQTKYGLSSNFIKALWYGEDWRGLEKLVEKSDLEKKQEVLAIINNDNKPDQKDKELKAIDNGITYRILFNQFYPKLRRSDYLVDYVVRGFTVEEGLEIIKIRPEQLSLNEFYAIANTYTENSEDYNRVFNIALEQYPDDPIANVNVAAIALKINEKSKAHRHLDRFKDHPDAWNNLGVLYLLEGDLNLAGEYFDKAVEGGNPDAVLNIEQLKLCRENLRNGVTD